MKNQPKRAEPQPRPGVEVGDHLFVHHGGKPCTGEVKAHGRHGVTVHVDGKLQRVPWDRVLGHKSRAPQRYSIVDEGDDGMLVEDAAGRRRYIATPNESKEDPMMVKALRQVLFLKAQPPGPAPRPGLSLQQAQSKNGGQVRRWKRTSGGEAPVQPGQHVGFQNGEHRGHGRVMAVGQHGATVQDAAGGRHRVPHGKITHRWEGDGTPDQSPHELEAQQAEARAAQRPFFDPAEVAALPPKGRVRQTVFKDWAGAEKIGPEAINEYGAILQGLAKQSGFEVRDSTPGDMAPEDLESDTGLIFVAPMKARDRAERKVKTDYAGDWTKLKDLVRATVAVKSVDDVRSTLEKLKAAGLQLAQKPKDNMTDGNADGYRDLNLVLKLPSGMLAELQIQVKAITKAKAEGHYYYEQNAALETKNHKAGKSDISEWDPADREAFNANREKQRSIYSAAWEQAQQAGQGAAAAAPSPDNGQPLQKSLGSSKMIVLLFGSRKAASHAVR